MINQPYTQLISINPHHVGAGCYNVTTEKKTRDATIFDFLFLNGDATVTDVYDQILGVSETYNWIRNCNPKANYQIRQ